MRCTCALLLLLNVLVAGEDRILVLRNARIHTVAKGVIERGTVVAVNGKIASVGPGELEVPEGAVVRDCAGKVVIPGLVDTHSHLGVYSRPRVVANSDGNEGSGPPWGVAARPSGLPLASARRTASDMPRSAAPATSP